MCFEELLPNVKNLKKILKQERPVTIFLHYYDKLDARELKRWTRFSQRQSCHDSMTNRGMIPKCRVLRSHPKKESVAQKNTEQMNTEHTCRNIPLQHRHKKRQEHNNTLTKQEATDREKRGARRSRFKKKAQTRMRNCAFRQSSEPFFCLFFGIDEMQ